jgi:hypothetical protein
LVSRPRDAQQIAKLAVQPGFNVALDYEGHIPIWRRGKNSTDYALKCILEIIDAYVADNALVTTSIPDALVEDARPNNYLPVVACECPYPCKKIRLQG